MSNNLKFLRNRAGLTQKELSSKSGVAQQKIATYENTESLQNITIGNIQRIAQALNVTIDDIIKEQECD